jgi:uncharacterized cupin superfamily protein
MNCKVASFNIGTGAIGTTVTVALPFSAKAGLLQWMGRTEATDTVGQATHLRGRGMFGVEVGTGTIEACALATRSEDNVATSIADNGHNFGLIITEKADGSAYAGQATIQSISSTQIVFEITQQFTTNLRVTGFFIGGSDVDAKLLAVSATGTAPVDQEVAGFPVAPKVVFTLNSNSIQTGGHAVDSHIGFGVGVSLTKQFGYAGGSNDNSGNAVTRTYMRTGDLIVSIANNFVAPVSERATLKSMTVTVGTGFTITWQAKSRDLRLYVLSLSGTFSVDAGSVSTQTDTTTDIDATTTFLPKGLLFVSHNKAENTTDVLSAHDKLSVGMATSTSEQHCQAMADENSPTTMSVTTAVDHDSVYTNLDEVSHVVQGSAHLTALSSTGFTLRMTDADPAQVPISWLALGDAPSTGNPWYAYAQQ